MKIKTITCHDVYNYGAALQAYALQTYLQSLGHDVEIIDYKPDYMRVHYKFWRVPEQSRYYERAMKSWLFHFMLCCYFIPRRYATVGRKFNFDAFVKQHLKLTRRYNSYQELVDCPPKADIYVAGSDQIWNSELPNGKDPGYFLQFGSKEVKRIAYAASFAISNIANKYKDLNKLWLNKFNAISVRERTGVSIVNSLGLECEEVVDPVFLLNKGQWDNFSGQDRIIKEKYILVYDLYVDDSRLSERSKLLASTYNLKIVSVDGSLKCPYAQKNISNAGPIEFVNLIKNAEYVVTNSFHATAFSVIFNKRFNVFYKLKNISRLTDFLRNVQLEFCLNPEKISQNYNWDVVNQSLINMCNSSIRYLSLNIK